MAEETQWPDNALLAWTRAIEEENVILKSKIDELLERIKSQKSTIDEMVNSISSPAVPEAFGVIETLKEEMFLSPVKNVTLITAKQIDIIEVALSGDDDCDCCICRKETAQ